MPTIGEQLKQTREARKLTIKQVVQSTHLRAHYLQAMEKDDFSAMPSIAQARGFLRLYAEFLGLDAGILIETLHPGKIVSKPVETVDQPTIHPVEHKPAIVLPEPAIPEEIEPVIPAGPPTPSQEIFNEIGLTMRNRRELISLTLEEVERHTHVRKHYLELIESGDFDKLPSPVQLRGTLSNYSSFLDLDSDTILLRYADAIQSRRIERQGIDKRKSSMQRARNILPAWLGRFISPDLIFGGSMILILLGLGIWGAERIFSGGLQTQISPTQGPSISDVLLASPVVSPTSSENIPTSVVEDGAPLSAVDATQVLPSDNPTATISSAVQVTVVVLESTFLRVTVDGKVQQNGRPSSGTALTFDATERIEVLTGSGAAVKIIFNQNDLGVLGDLGEVVDRIYSVGGVETPTPTASPTATITPIPSLTLRPSVTPRPSSTLRPTSTPRPTLTKAP